MKKCILCGNTIPRTRKKSSTHCSDECYNERKRERSSRRYHRLKEQNDEINRNESILAFLYKVAAMNKLIIVDDLTRNNFNFGISNGEHIDDKKRLFKIIGKYSYYLEPNKTVTIWKSK